MSNETCPVMVSGGPWAHRHTCGRPVKENGKCGVHARVDRRRAEQDERSKANRAEGLTRMERSKPLKEALETLGIHAGFAGEWTYGADLGPHEVCISARYFDALTTILQEHILEHHLD